MDLFSAMNLSPSIAMYHGQLVALRDVSFQGPVTKLDMQEFKNVNKIVSKFFIAGLLFSFGYRHDTKASMII